jgi:putative heme-binding domain-containing protein
MTARTWWCGALALWGLLQGVAQAEGLHQQLARETAARLAADALAQGDPARGAVLFHQPYLGCTKCHAVTENEELLGPNLTRLPDPPPTADIVQSVLQPSQAIRKGYEAVTVELTSGQTRAGRLIESTAGRVVLRETPGPAGLITIARDQIESEDRPRQSLMPDGQMNLLASRQQFLDLVAYLDAIIRGGPQRALELQPNPALYAPASLPAYEQQLDHRGLIAGWNDQTLAQGEAIFRRVCANCHGLGDQPGSLPTALRFATGRFKNGAEPLAMYQTLTRGFGLMPAQGWMVPRQKYAVIQYIRERILRTANPTQFVPVDEAYLASLPSGDTRGPEPSSIDPWVAMDYGPLLSATIEVGADGSNFAMKGVAQRLDAGAGGISRGSRFSLFDLDTLRMAAAWHGPEGGAGFIDWHAILFDGQHGVHPRVTGEVVASNSTGPGWANPLDGQWRDPRPLGRDKRPYGPLPAEWARYVGRYRWGGQHVLAYRVGSTLVHERHSLGEWPQGATTPANTPDESSSPANGRESAVPSTGGPVFVRTLDLGARERPLKLLVAERRSADEESTVINRPDQSLVRLARPVDRNSTTKGPAEEQRLLFDGQTSVEFETPPELDWNTHDLTFLARIQTRQGGTLLCQTTPGPVWVPGGKSWFVRDGRLVFDIGWVGAVTGRTRIDDGRWHHVACTWQHETGQIVMYVDGQVDGRGRLAPGRPLAKSVTRVGFTAGNFPAPQSAWVGELPEIQVRAGVLEAANIAKLQSQPEQPAPFEGAVAGWRLATHRERRIASQVPKGPSATVVPVTGVVTAAGPGLLAGVAGDIGGLQWSLAEQRLVLEIPAGRHPLSLSVWVAPNPPDLELSQLAGPNLPKCVPFDKLPQESGGLWPGVVEVPVRMGTGSAPLVVDELVLPVSNPWLAQIRPTGLDFFTGGDRMAVCTWDGDVWLVSGLKRLAGATGEPAPVLTWKRFASGLFQPLGLRVIDGRIHVTCRDQLAVLHDRDGDDEADWFECLNTDHQVTEHFHEFAMGLQTDAEGNFYYAKSARHALPALVPQHGTLLKVARDGSQTEILATGFRAANGVCLNPDGSFMVTDQEGHWNPKNRINRVVPGRFYGNMFGYHDITDSSDSAMEPPLCWITNAFDRSPAELLWVNSPAWGGLQGSLLNLSYGYGKIFVVPHEKLGDRWQGGMVELPLPGFPTGLIRGRFSPTDGQLYACGMFAWAGSATQPGGLYRIRATGQPVPVPTTMAVTPRGLRLRFPTPLNPQSVQDLDGWACKIWGLKRSANYGSEHVNERKLDVLAARLLPDGQTVEIELQDLQPTWGMEVRYSLQTAAGAPVRGVLHSTIHEVPKAD